MQRTCFDLRSLSKNETTGEESGGLLRVSLNLGKFSILAIVVHRRVTCSLPLIPPWTLLESFQL